MSKININGAELELDMLDADTVEKAENAIEHTRVRAAELEADKSMKASEGIRATCREVFECFNTIFGEGTDKKVFGTRTNLGECLDAFAQLSQHMKQDGQKQIAALTQKYIPNRETRRQLTKIK